jgi:hypothetical protein
VLALIADSVKSNIRELEGSLVKLLVHASVYKKDVTIEMAHDVLKDFVKTFPRKTSISTIQKVVSQHYRVPVESMRSKVRTARLAFPRQIAIYLARDLTSASLRRSGQRFGGRDHTTCDSRLPEDHRASRARRRVAFDHQPVAQGVFVLAINRGGWFETNGRGETPRPVFFLSPVNIVHEV